VGRLLPADFFDGSLPTRQPKFSETMDALTLQPNGSVRTFDPTHYPPVTRLSTEARVLNMGPPHVDIAMPAGCFESTFGPVQRRQRIGRQAGCASERTASFRCSLPAYGDALAQITAIPDQAASGKRRATSLPQRPKVRKRKPRPRIRIRTRISSWMKF
jgi:hypothetical protein